MSFETDVADRLRRMETKMIRGFEELGVDTDSDPNWLTVDEPSRTLFVATLGRSLLVMRSVAIQRGAKSYDKPYEIVHRGNVVGTLILRD